MFGISSFWKGIDLVIVELHFIIAIETKRFSFFYYILSYMYVYISTWGYVHMDVYLSGARAMGSSELPDMDA